MSTAPVVKPEVKAYDISLGVSSYIAAGSYELLNNPLPGTDFFSRIGRKVQPKSVHIRGIIRPIPTLAADIAPDVLRTLLVWDKQCNAATASVQDILRDANSGGSTSVLSHVNLDNRERFIILRDQHFPTTKLLVANQELWAPLDQVKPSFNFDWFVKLPKTLHSSFNGGSSGTITDMTTGSLFLFTILGNSANNFEWELAYTSRYRFYDV